jgi:hypothetical protein
MTRAPALTGMVTVDMKVSFCWTVRSGQVLADEAIGLGELAAVMIEKARDLALGLALAGLNYGVYDAREESALLRVQDGCVGSVRHERDVAGHKEGFEGHGDLLLKRTDPRRFLLVVLS